MMLNPGDNVLNFEVFAFCGSGAFGEVYAVRDAQNRHYALKVIPKQRLADAGARELRGLARYQEIAHGCSALLRIHQVYETTHELYILMDLADNRDATDTYSPDTLDFRLANSGALPPTELSVIVNELLFGLRQLHRHGLAHRDLKPSNIVFVNGCAKICDLGLLLSDTSVTNHLAGTLDFIAPERRSGGILLSGLSCMEDDFYALGKVIYCAMTGNPAYLYPSIPDAMPITPEMRAFNRFISKLCTPVAKARLKKYVSVQKYWLQTESVLNPHSPNQKMSRSMLRLPAAGWLTAIVWRKLSGNYLRSLTILALSVLLLLGVLLFMFPKQNVSPSNDSVLPIMDARDGDDFCGWGRGDVILDEMTDNDSYWPRSNNSSTELTRIYDSELDISFSVPRNWKYNPAEPGSLLDGQIFLSPPGYADQSCNIRISPSWATPSDFIPISKIWSTAPPQRVQEALLYGSILASSQRDKEKYVISTVQKRQYKDFINYSFLLTEKSSGRVQFVNGLLFQKKLILITAIFPDMKMYQTYHLSLENLLASLQNGKY